MRRYVDSAFICDDGHPLQDPFISEIGYPCNMPLTSRDGITVAYCGVIVRTIKGFWWPVKKKAHWFEPDGRPVYHAGRHGVEWGKP